MQGHSTKLVIQVPGEVTPKRLKVKFQPKSRSHAGSYLIHETF